MNYSIVYKYINDNDKLEEKLINLPIKINEYDTINNIKQYIVLYSKDVLNIESIFLCYKENNDNELLYQKIYNYYLNKNKLDILESYNLSKEEISKFINRISFDNINYDIFSDKLEKLLKNKNINNKQLGYQYINKRQIMLIDTDIYNNIKLDSNFDSSINTINLNKSDENKIISTFKIKGNKIILYNFKNIHEYILRNKIFNLDTETSKKIYINQFVKKYFYKINNYKLINKVLKENKKIIENYKVIYDPYIVISKYIEKNENKIKKGKITNYFSNRPYNFNNFIVNIEKIYNEFELTFDIPFVIYNDESNNYLYKFNKNIYISIEKMKNWTNHIMYNHITNKTKELFLPDLTFKIFYDFNYDSNIFKSVKSKIINYNENNETYDILVDYQNKENKQVIKNIKLDKKIIEKYNLTNNPIYKDFDFDYYEGLYFDLNIQKNGDISIYANFNINQDKINNCIDIFFDQLNTINYRLNNKYIKIDEIDNKNELYNFETSYELPKNHSINLNNLYKVLNCFKSFFTISNIQYNKNDIINISITNYNNEKAIVLDYNIDNTYLVQMLKDNKKFKIHYNYIINTNNEYIELNYKKVNNYKDTNPIFNLVNKLKSLNKSDEEIVLYIQKEFLKDKEEAEKYLSLDEDKKINVNKIIKLYIFSNNVRNNEISYPIKLYDIESKEEYEQIKIIINSVITLYNNINKNNNLLKKICNSEEIKNENTIEDSSDNNSDLFSDDSDEGFGILDSYEKKSEIKKEEEFIEIIDKQMGQMKRKDYFLNRMYNYDSELFKWESKNNKQYSRLCAPKDRYPIPIDNDELESIFNDDNLDLNNLSKKDLDDIKLTCDIDIKKKINITIDKLNKKKSDEIIEVLKKDFNLNENIAEKYYLSYKMSNKDIEKYLKKKKRDKDYNKIINFKNFKCSSFRYRDNWYICPKIWCVEDQISIHPNKLDSDDDHNFECDYTEDWRTCKICQKDILEHKVKCPICKKTILKNSKLNYATDKESLYILSEKEESYYPGLMKNINHPKGYYPPCCFSIPNKFQNFLEIKDHKGVDNYIQKYNTILEKDKYGILPNKINLLFNEKNIESGFSKNIDKVFIRKGYYTNNEIDNNNNFLLVILDIINNYSNKIYNFIDNEFSRRKIEEEKKINEIVKKFNISNDDAEEYYDNYKEKDEYTIEELKKKIVDNLKLDEFKKLNYDNLNYVFRGLDDITAYQNYLEYIISSDIIQYEYLWNLFCSGYYWLPEPFCYNGELKYSSNGVNLYILNIQNNIESILIPNFNYNKKVNIILLRNNNNFELIGYKGEHVTLEIGDCIFSNLDKKSNKIERKVKEIINNLIDKYDEPSYKKISNNIKKKVLDKYNNIIGLILKDNFYYPINPYKNIDKRSFVYIDEINDNNLLSYNEYLTKYKELDMTFVLKYKIVNDDNKITHILTEDNKVIPLKISKYIKDDLEDMNDNILQFNYLYKKNYNYNFDKKDDIDKVIDELKDYEIIENENNNNILDCENKKSGNTINLIYDNKIELNGSKYQKDFDIIVEEYTNLYYLSNFRLNVKPIRVVIDDDSKKVTHILLNNGSKIPVTPFDLSNMDIDEDTSKTDFEINKLYNYQYKVLDYNINNELYNHYVGEINDKLDEYKYENMIYKKYLYKMSNKIKKILSKKIKKYIDLRDYNKIKDEIEELTNNIYIYEDFCMEIDKEICRKIFNDNKEKYTFRLINDLITNKIISNKFLNKKIDKYINNDNYIEINRLDLNEEIMDNLYKKRKSLFIQFPNLFNDINVIKKKI